MKLTGNDLYCKNIKQIAISADDKLYKITLTRLDDSRVEIPFQQILQDQELRKEIVDLADIWDGEESIKYGKVLMGILNKLGIKDIPEFYSEKNISKITKENTQKILEEEKCN